MTFLFWEWKLEVTGREEMAMIQQFLVIIYDDNIIKSCFSVFFAESYAALEY